MFSQLHAVKVQPLGRAAGWSMSRDRATWLRAHRCDVCHDSHAATVCPLLAPRAAAPVPAPVPAPLPEVVYRAPVAARVTGLPADELDAVPRGLAIGGAL